MPHTWNFDTFCWLGELHVLPIAENRRLILQGHVFVHHGTISVPGNVSRQSLQWPAPRHLTTMDQRHLDPFEMAESPLGHCVADHIHQTVIQSLHVLEIYRYMDEIITTVKSVLIQERCQTVPGAIMGNVAENKRRPLIYGYVGFLQQTLKIDLLMLEMSLASLAASTMSGFMRNDTAICIASPAIVLRWRQHRTTRLGNHVCHLRTWCNTPKLPCHDTWCANIATPCRTTTR